MNRGAERKYPLPSAYCRLPTVFEGGVGDGTTTHSPSQDVTLVGEEESLVTSKIIDQCGYIYENKGQALKTKARSGNVDENKGDTNLKLECY
jgi:hypothetical protein